MADVRVLHVDDDRDTRDLVAASLALDSEFQTRSCASGADALVSADEWSPSIILLDVAMPQMDGLMTLTKLRRNPQTGHIPVVFLTTFAQSYEIEKYLSLGAQGVFAKPFNPMTLAASVRDRLSRPFEHNVH
jgi:CheY-like chemotaxis protein